MYCNCKESSAFCVSFEKEENYICRYYIYKCNRLKTDGVKKQPCDFYKKELISKVNDTYIEKCKETFEIHKRNYRQELYRYIDLCEKIGPNENYYGNIVNRMSILGYKYIPSENLSRLKKRLCNPPYKLSVNLKKLPMVVVPVPKELEVIKGKPIKNKKIIKKKTFQIVDIIETESDDEEENINEEDNLFDVDDLESVEDEDDIEYEGYFSE